MIENLAQEKEKTWIVFDRNSKEIQRVVQCHPMMVTMSGMWSNQWAYVAWEDLIDAHAKMIQEVKTHYDHGNGD